MKWFEKMILVMGMLIGIITSNFYNDKEVAKKEEFKVKEKVILETGSKKPSLEDFTETWGEIGTNIEISYQNQNDNNELQVLIIYKNINGEEVSYEDAIQDDILKEGYQQENILIGTGVYTVSIKDEIKEYKSLLVIEDTIAPLLEGRDVIIEEGEVITPNLFVSSCTDNSREECKYYFVDKEGKEIEKMDVNIGEQEIYIIAKDSSSNQSEIVTVKLNVNKKEIVSEINNEMINNTLSSKQNEYSQNKINQKEGFYYNDKVEDFKVVSFYGSETDREMLEYINSYRRKVGLGNLQLSENLNKAATLRAAELALSFSHTRPNGLSWPSVLSEFSISYSFAAENVSYGYGTSLDSADKAAKAFRNSEGHYQNMISSSINYMGVGKYIQNGSTYWAIIFTS